MNGTATAICRFVAPDGLMRYSVRQRPDGLFVVIHDGAILEDGSQPYWMEDRILSGLLASAELAEAALRQMIRDGWAQEL